jgi:sterol 24-C-methyltransferase
VVEEEDLTRTADVPWYEPIDAYRPLTLATVLSTNFRTTALGRRRAPRSPPLSTASRLLPSPRPAPRSSPLSLPPGRRSITHYFVWALEKLGIAPKGSVGVSSFLVVGADALVEGGRKDIFTPMYFTLARKPLK